MEKSWFDSVDAYCERTDAALWSEPLNALSNASFILAGALLLPQVARSGSRNPLGFVLIANVLLIGVGSFLYHTLANRWSMLADVLPIAIFINLFILLALRAFLKVSWPAAIALAAGFFVLSFVAGPRLEELFGSSASYFPALLAVLVLAIASRNHCMGITSGLLAASAVFALALAFRALDLPLCAMWPAGTHLMWHLLNGLALYLMVRLYLNVTATPGAR